MINWYKYRFDMVLSYWIFTWYILYVLKIVSASPKLALILALIENILILILLIYMKVPAKTIILFVIINIFIKIIPLITIWSDKIELPNDLYVFGQILLVYYIWIYIIDKKVLNEKWNIFKIISEGKYNSKYMPLSSLILDLLK